MISFTSINISDLINTWTNENPKNPNPVPTSQCYL